MQIFKSKLYGKIIPIVVFQGDEYSGLTQNKKESSGALEREVEEKNSGGIQEKCG
jgi:hypothetical protein